MNNKFPKNYENEFNLLLSIIQNTKKEKNNLQEINNYFNRISKGTLGELEFLKRMGYENIPIIRLYASPILWEEYNQEKAPDFLTIINNKLSCVDVKNHDWRKYIKQIIINKNAVECIERFKKYFKLENAYFAIKRFERWYLLDTNFIKQFRIFNNNYIINISKANRNNILNENFYVFNLGNKADYKLKKYTNNKEKKGVFYKKLNNFDNKEYIDLWYGNNSDSKKIRYFNTEKTIIQECYKKIYNNIKNLIKEGYSYYEIEAINDILPTEFYLYDNVNNKDFKQNITKLDKILIKGDFNSKEITYHLYRIYNIEWFKYKQKLNKLGIRLDDIKKVKKLIYLLNK